MKSAKTTAEFKHQQFKKKNKWNIIKTQKKKDPNNNKEKDKEEVLMDEYKRLKKIVRNFETTVSLMKTENISLIRNNEGLLKKLSGEREEYTQDLQNMFILFFNTIKKMDPEKFIQCKNQIEKNELFTEEEKESLRQSDSFMDLIPLLTRYFFINKKEKKKLFNCLKDLFKDHPAINNNSPNEIMEINMEEEDMKSQELDSKMIMSMIRESYASHSSENYSKLSEIIRIYSEGFNSINEKSLSSLLRRGGRSFDKKSSNISTRSYERSSEIQNDNFSKSY